MVSRARDLAELIKANSAISVPSGNTAQRPTGEANFFRYNTQTAGFEGYTTNWGAIAGAGESQIGVGMSLYSNVSSFPASANVGQQAFATDTSSVYIWNGTVWYLISTATTPTGAPAITIGPNSSYRLSTDGTPTIITLTAVDPEGSNVIWSYAVTGGSLANTATISQVNNVFTITPSTEANNAGVFVLTFTASDGSNISIARTTVRLSFVLMDYAVGFRLTGQSLIPYVSGSTENGKFGVKLSAYNNKLAVVGAGVSSNAITGTVTFATHPTPTYSVGTTSIYVYDTTNYGNPVLTHVFSGLNDITPTSGVTNSPKTHSAGLMGVAIYDNMLVISQPYSHNQFGDRSGPWYFGLYYLVYYKSTSNNVYSLTQTLYFSTNISGYENVISTVPRIPSILEISNNGLFMLLGINSSINLYRRANTTANSWSLATTINSGNIGSSTNASGGASGGTLHFKGAKISNTGKHIVLYSNENDTTTPSVTDGGRIIILTNTNAASNGTSWTKTFDRSPVTGNSTTISVQVSCHEDEEDIFYGLYQRSNTSLSTLEMLKFDNFSSVWTLKQYDSYGGKILSSNVATTGSLNYFSAFPPASGYSNVAFGSIRAESHTGLPSFVVIRGENGDITSTSNTSFASTANSYWLTPHLLPNQVVEPFSGQDPNLVRDVATGEVYVSLPNTNYPDANSGIVLKYTPAFANGAADYIQSYEKIVVGNTASGNVTVVVPYGIRYLHGVCVGAGANLFNTVKGGGGALKWVSNYSVNQGDVITLKAGATGDYPNCNSSIYINGQRVIEAGGCAVGLSAPNGRGRQLTGTMTIGATTGGGDGGMSYTNSSQAGGAGGYNGYGGGASNGGEFGNGTYLPAVNSGAGAHGGASELAGGVGIYGIANTGDPNVIKHGSIENMPAPYNIAYGWGSEATGIAGTGAVRLLLGDSFVFANTAANTSVFVRPIGYLGPE